MFNVEKSTLHGVFPNARTRTSFGKEMSHVTSSVRLYVDEILNEIPTSFIPFHPLQGVSWPAESLLLETICSMHQS
jgi:hypothetical protein